MKSIPTQERAVRKRIALLKAAIDEFSESGFEVATAKTIAARAGVATGTFYQYFENKSDILLVIAENRYAELYEQVAIVEKIGMGDSAVVTKGDELFSQTLRQAFIRVLTFLYEFHVQDALLHQVLDQRRGLDQGLDEIMTRGEDLMRSHLIGFVNELHIADAELVAAGLFAMGEGLVHRMVFGRSPEDPEKMLEIGAHMLASYFENNLDT